MKVRLWIVACLLFWWTGGLFAQPAPNRAGEVAQILSDLPRQVKTPADDGRRANLYAIVRGLTAQGDCCWGVLLKTDQGNKIPADVIVWRPTLEHFDVITGDGAPFWEAHGPVGNGRWLWQAVPDAPAPPSQPPSPPPPSSPPPSRPPAPPAPAPSVDLGPILLELSALQVSVAAVKTVADQARDEAAAAHAEIVEHRKEVKGFIEQHWPKIVSFLGGAGTVIAWWRSRRGQDAAK